METKTVPTRDDTPHAAYGEALVFHVHDLDCADCAAHLEEAISSLPDVAEVHLDFMRARLRVVPEAGSDIAERVTERAKAMGHTLHAEGAHEEHTDAHEHGNRGNRQSFLAEHRRDVTTAISGLFILLALAARWTGLPEQAVIILFAASIVSGGYYVTRSAWTSLRATRSLDMNALMTLAIVGAMFIGEWFEGAMVIFLFSVGETLESYTMERARNAISTLVALSPREAIRIHGDHQDRVPVQELRIGDTILVPPGERIAMDGAVTSGYSAVNQAPVTGESVPVDIEIGDPVFAGSINGQGVLTVRVTRLAEDNTIARVIRMVEEAQEQRAPAQRFVDTFARYYTPAIVVIAFVVVVLPPVLGMGTWSEWLYRGLVLLVIGCPCALVISTPVSIVSAITSAARAGVIVKGGSYLEALGKVRVVAFDKTGTLTRGEPQVVDARCPVHAEPATTAECAACRRMLTVAAAIESQSEHPLAQAIVREAQRQGLDWTGDRIEDVAAVSGRGIRGKVNGHPITLGSHTFIHPNHDTIAHDPAFCRTIETVEANGNTVMVVDCANCGVQGYIAVADTLRDDAAEAIRELKASGITRTVMLTGDNAITAAVISKLAGIDEFKAGLLPENKVAAVEDLLTAYGDVAMVGDGINDAPALAKATVGIAMGAAGSATALETADIALMTDNLLRLPFSIRLGRRTLATIQQNIAFALALKVVFLVLAVLGIATLWMAVFADVGASLIVILNGMRLLRVRPAA